MTMEISVSEIPYKSVQHSSVGGCTKTAWARYAARRWPSNTLKCVMTEWGLSEGRARGLLYGQVTQATIDAVLSHRRGGFALGLEILAITTGLTLEQFIEQQAREAAHERAQWEAREQHLARMEDSLRRRPAERRRVDREAGE